MKKAKKKSRDLLGLRRMVSNLTKYSESKLENAVCDIIDIGGYSIAVLLDELNLLPIPVQLVVVRKIEDYIYFHPEHGIKLISRLLRTIQKADNSCKASLLATLADICEELDENDNSMERLKIEALSVLSGDIDPSRMSKAVELISKASAIDGIPTIINLMIGSCKKIDQFDNYHFIETSLLALKRLGREPLLRLLINPVSVDAIRQLRLEWRNADPLILQSTFEALQRIDTDFAQLMMKVIDLSDFNLPFVTMIKEGLEHGDKWVRQEAVAAMRKAAEAFNPEILSRMLTDEASEVRIMATASLGGFASSQTGELLESLALKASESLEVRLNALYALFAQKSYDVLKKVANSSDNARITINAEGLAALLMPHDEGLKSMLKSFSHTVSEFSAEATHYLLEIAEPEDIGNLINAHGIAPTEIQRERIIIFIKQFIDKKAGPRLNAAKSSLSEAERKALEVLDVPFNQKDDASLSESLKPLPGLH